MTADLHHICPVCIQHIRYNGISSFCLCSWWIIRTRNSRRDTAEELSRGQEQESFVLVGPWKTENVQVAGAGIKFQSPHEPFLFIFRMIIIFIFHFLSEGEDYGKWKVQSDLFLRVFFYDLLWLYICSRNSANRSFQFNRQKDLSDGILLSLFYERPEILPEEWRTVCFSFPRIKTGFKWQHPDTTKINGRGGFSLCLCKERFA